MAPEVYFKKPSDKRADIWACRHCRHGASKYGVGSVPENWDMKKMESPNQGISELFSLPSGVG